MSQEFGGAYWEDRYASGQPTSKSAASPSLLVEAGGLAPGTALDAGCGHGADARWLADRGWQVTAVDVSATAVAAARTTDERVTWLQADLTTWEPGRLFDLVTSHHVHAPGPPQELFARLASWVAPGGTLLVVGHDDGHGHGHDDGHGQEHGQEHGHGHGHDDGQPPPQAQVGTAHVIAGLPPDAWEVLTAERRVHTVARPDGGEAVLHDVVVRARRRG